MSDVMSDFIETPPKSYAKKPMTGIAAPPRPKTKKEKIEIMSNDQFKKTKQAHKAEIAKLKITRKKIKQDIKRHKLLIKQAKIINKLSKMKGEK